jgi:predicted CoA-substrate-specific enzyme activase
MDTACTAYYAGVDIGSSTTKCVIMNEKGVFQIGKILPTSKDINKVSNAIIDICVDSLGIVHDDLNTIVTTGYGRYMPSYTANVLPEIQAIGIGLFESYEKKDEDEWPKLILDIGGQDCKALLINCNGNIEKFTTNGKCAAGTGKFIEYIGRRYKLSLKEMSEIATHAKNRCDLKSQCGIFIESEINKLIHHGDNFEDVLAGLFFNMLNRILGIIHKLNCSNETLYFTGGVSQNAYLVNLLKDHFKHVIVPEEPQLICAKGAAFHAQVISKSDDIKRKQVKI